MSTAKTDRPIKTPTKVATAAARRPQAARSQPAPVEAKSAPIEPAVAPAPVVKPAPATRAKLSKVVASRAGQARKASVMLKFVSDPTRLQVVLLLAEAEHHVGALCEQLGQSQPAVSHHLALLRHGGIIIPRRNGKNNFYSLSGTGAELAKVLKLLIQST